MGDVVERQCNSGSSTVLCVLVLTSPSVGLTTTANDSWHVIKVVDEEICLSKSRYKNPDTTKVVRLLSPALWLSNGTT